MQNHYDWFKDYFTVYENEKLYDMPWVGWYEDMTTNTKNKIEHLKFQFIVRTLRNMQFESQQKRLETIDNLILILTGLKREEFINRSGGIKELEVEKRISTMNVDEFLQLISEEYDNAAVNMSACSQRDTLLRNAIIYGPPYSGKTTMVNKLIVKNFPEISLLDTDYYYSVSHLLNSLAEKRRTQKHVMVFTNKANWFDPIISHMAEEGRECWCGVKSLSNEKFFLKLRDNLLKTENLRNFGSVIEISSEIHRFLMISDILNNQIVSSLFEKLKNSSITWNVLFIQD